METEISREKQLKKEKLIAEALFDNSTSAIVLLDNNHRIIKFNQKFTEKFGYELDEIKGEHIDDILERNKPGSADLSITERTLSGEQVKTEGIRYDRDGKPIHFLIKGVPILIDGEVEGIYGIYDDITKIKETRKKLEVKEEQYRKLFNKSPVGMLLIERDGNILKVNDNHCKISGYSKDELIGNNIFETVVPPEYKKEARDNIDDILSGVDKEYIGKSIDRNEETYYILFKETRIKMPDGSYAVLSMQLDYTEYKEQQEKIEYISFHDKLTGLYNRFFMEEEIERLDTKRQLPISIIMADVNGLKLINDTYGHEQGDEILKRVSKVLLKSVRKEDIVARWAGDEFLILLPQTDKENVDQIRLRIKEEGKKTEADKIPIALGVGVATKKETNENIYDAIHRADKNMYQDKLTDSKSSKNKIVQSFLNTLGAKSDETEEHAMRMAKVAFNLGESMNLSNEQLNNLSLLATLHDIGKVTIPADILNKPGKLTEEEWDIITEHPETGYRIAINTEEFAKVARAILCHHERWDGSGYPQGLKGRDIPLLARIITIVDAYDVMTNGRPYKKAISKNEAVEEIQRCAGSQFDPELVDKFKELMLNN